MQITKAQRDELQRALRKRRAALRAEIRGDVARSREESFGELSGSVHDTGDESVADLVSDLDNAETGRDLQELREVEAALERIAAGGYGSCSSCGGPIGFERLRAQPAAARCIACQRREEKTAVPRGPAKL
jgi:RNA polymerase-binding protein DksA